MKKSFLLLLLCGGANLCTTAQNTNRAMAANSNCYGMTASGGHKGYGVIYNYNTSNGKDTVPYNFSYGGLDGVYPFGSLLQASNGKLYGMTETGGLFNLGTLFCFDPATNTDTVLVNFSGPNGSSPFQSNLVQASNGKLYGLTPNGGKFDNGVVFSFDINTNVQTVLVDIGDSIGAGPQGGLMEASNHVLYGMTVVGGTYGDGTIFTFNTVTNKDSVIFNFNDTNGYQPWGNLLQASDGMLYGMTSGGGANSQGVVFRYDPVKYKDTVLVNFNGTNGADPEGNLMQASNGLLYGMSEFGGTNNGGVIFSYDITKYQDSVVHNFGNGYDGNAPMGSLMQASNGLLYGLTWGGGNYNFGNGTLFSFNTITSQDSVIVNFQYLGNKPAAGFSPYGNLIQATNGRLYGLTAFGGNSNEGVLFSYYPGNATDSTLHCFGGGSNTGNFMQAKDGMLYGVTAYGGTQDLGTLFRYNPTTGKDTVLMSFAGPNGALPGLNNSLYQGTDGWLYGMTAEGGLTNQGVLYKFNPVTYKDSTIFSFIGLNGINPNGGLFQASDSMFYGMAIVGGTHGDGLMFRFNPKTNQDTILLNFDSANGSWPYTTFIQAKNGLLYGMTDMGGTYDLGTMFSYDIKKFKDSILFSFNDTNGGYPEGNLLQGIDGKLYGLTTWTEYGTNYYGNLFRYDPTTGQDTVLLYFDGVNTGAQPLGTLVQDSTTGLLYGTTSEGGSHNYGTMFSYNPYTYKDSVLIVFADTNGANPNDLILVHGSVLGVNEIKPETEIILVYPNPYTTMANVVFASIGKHYVEVDNVLGEKLETIECMGKQCQISRNGNPPGVYFVKVYDANMKFIGSSKIIAR